MDGFSRRQGSLFTSLGFLLSTIFCLYSCPFWAFRAHYVATTFWAFRAHYVATTFWAFRAHYVATTFWAA